MFELPFDRSQCPTAEQYAEYQRLSQEWEAREAARPPTLMRMKLDPTAKGD
jgi:hypothetical protein